MLASRHVEQVTLRRLAFLAFHVAAVLLCACSGGLDTMNPGTTTPAAGEPTIDRPIESGPSTPLTGLVQARVIRVIDGDTIEVDRALDGRATLRYIGIDTPETVAPGQPVACYGREASEHNRLLVEGETVYLEKDTSDVDRFGRLLRYVYLEDGSMVNELLVRGGYAVSRAYPPDTAHQSRLETAVADARTANRGMWASCPSQISTPTRTAGQSPTAEPSSALSACPEGCATELPGCPIKGNINASGVRIYHVPGSGSYSDTVITPANGERWFCSVEEAVANGWRAAQN